MSSFEEKLKELGFENYEAYLCSDHWKSIKDRAFHTNCLRCFICDSKTEVHLHHISYCNLGHERLLTDIYPLCQYHHEMMHDYMKKKGILIHHDTFKPAVKYLFIWDDTKFNKRQENFIDSLYGQGFYRKNNHYNRINKNRTNKNQNNKKRHKNRHKKRKGFKVQKVHQRHLKHQKKRSGFDEFGIFHGSKESIVR